MSDFFLSDFRCHTCSGFIASPGLASPLPPVAPLPPPLSPSPPPSFPSVLPPSPLASPLLRGARRPLRYHCSERVWRCSSTCLKGRHGSEISHKPHRCSKPRNTYREMSNFFLQLNECAFKTASFIFDFIIRFDLAKSHELWTLNPKSNSLFIFPPSLRHPSPPPPSPHSGSSLLAK